MLARRALLLAASLLTVAAAPPPGRPGAAKLPTQQKESFSEADGAVVISGRKVEYKSTSGRLPVKDPTGKAPANIFFVAYTKKGVAPASRPLTFCFNGGPGSSAVWLHLGAFGPRRVLMADDGKTCPQPTRLVENEWSLLDITDLVFIDPVSTGYSRAVNSKEAKLFHGVEEDVQSVGDFIRQYTIRYKRVDSPKYLAGESYGTTRAAGLASYLQGRGGVRLTGVMLISVVLDFQTIRFDEGNDLPYSLFLPACTAAAWYHKKLGKSSELSSVLEESSRFADGEYARALRKGNRLSDVERRAVAKKLAGFTGLSEKVVLQSNLRVDANRFRRELLRDRGARIGCYDSRLSGKDRVLGRSDPSFAAVRGPFTEAMNSYLPNGLKYKTSLNYEMSGASVRPWNYGKSGMNRYVNVAPRLRLAMEKNRSLRVFVANGYYDLTTPFTATQYTFAHLGSRSLTDRVTMAYYEAGHMMYTHKPSLKKLKADIARFMGSQTESPVPLE